MSIKALSKPFYGAQLEDGRIVDKTAEEPSNANIFIEVHCYSLAPRVGDILHSDTKGFMGIKKRADASDTLKDILYDMDGNCYLVFESDDLLFLNKGDELINISEAERDMRNNNINAKATHDYP